MDSLISKVGSLRSFVPASPGRPCEGACEASHAAQAAPRSVQMCACRSPPPASTIASSVTPPSAEEAASKHGSFLPLFNPLPLLVSYSGIPTPLKFLWFSNDREQESRPSESLLLVDTETCEERKTENTRNDLNSNEYLSLKESQEFVDGFEEHVREHEWNLSEANEITQTRQRSCHILETDVSADKEILDRGVNGSVLDDELTVDAVDDVLLHETNTTEDVDTTSPPRRQGRSWISRVADIKRLWLDPKDPDKQNTLSQGRSQESESAPLSPSCSESKAVATADHTTKPSEAGVACTSSCALGCSLKIPYTKVLHTKESFSKFLQNTALYDMKILAQLAYLCDMAYTIQNIQPRQLMRYHHLRLVTSSLEKKAEADNKMQEDESSKKPGGEQTLKISADNGGLVSSVVPNLLKSNMASDSDPPELSSAAHSNGVDMDGSSLIEEQEASSLHLTDHEQGQSNSLPGLDFSEDEHKAVNEVSLSDTAAATAKILSNEETKAAVSKNVRSCPCEWFVCDELDTHTRIFVIQGSESWASWQANLFFEPTKFEGLDVFVHRGIYEAATAMYDEILPELLTHISTHGNLARTRFTGHSLGGSLASLLVLMFQIRGVLPSTAILPVVTFGSPCIMCGGDYLLQKLKLSRSHIQSVMMHRDVVPRAFACEYPDHVAEVLRRLNGRFRDYPCLDNQKLLYAPMGQLLILQPSESVAPPHPLLPDGHGLHALRHPMNGDDMENVIELREAQRAFLNMPHPIDILGDPGAYGFDGAVSRDHDPQSYVKALHAVLKQEVKRLRRVQRDQRRQHWWPSVIAESSSSRLHKGVHAHPERIGPLSTSFHRTSQFFKQPINSAIAKHMEFSMHCGSIWKTHKDALRGYTRLVTSRHIQMGLLLVLSLRVVILESLSTLFVWV